MLQTPHDDRNERKVCEFVMARGLARIYQRIARVVTLMVRASSFIGFEPSTVSMARGQGWVSTRNY
jgi:hypothetical protein